MKSDKNKLEDLDFLDIQSKNNDNRIIIQELNPHFLDQSYERSVPFSENSATPELVKV